MNDNAPAGPAGHMYRSRERHLKDTKGTSRHGRTS